MSSSSVFKNVIRHKLGAVRVFAIGIGAVPRSCLRLCAVGEEYKQRARARAKIVLLMEEMVEGIAMDQRCNLRFLQKVIRV
jgi:hypothetical protein